MNAPMLMLNGQVLHVFEAPKGKNKEGQEYGGGYRVQLVVMLPLTNGEYRNDLVTLGTDQPDFFQDRVGRSVSLPVGVFATGKGVQFFILKGADLGRLAADARAVGASSAAGATGLQV